MSVEGLQPVRQPPRLYEFWDMIRGRLNTATMRKILNVQDGSGIYIPGDDIPTEEADRSGPWGRVVVVPVVASFAGEEQLGRDRTVPFLIRCDYNRPTGAHFDVFQWIEAAHAEAFRQLHGWLPDNTMEFAQFNFPVHRQEEPMAAPLWDDEDSLWYVSALYHAFVSPKEIA